MDIGKRVFELRKNAGFTQEELAEKLNISRQSITKWENNDSAPDIDRLVELSSIFGVTIDFLFKGRIEYTKNDNAVSDNLNEIKLFLCTAKKNTYAAHSSEIKSSRLHSHDLCYNNEKYLYLDSYFGGENFIGEEVLYIDNKPYWSMNYMGRILDNNFSGDFLKECLLAVNIDKPYRGPEIYQNGNFTYHCNIKGSFDWFLGEEEIFFQSKKVYECLFHGSVIK